MLVWIACAWVLGLFVRVYGSGGHAEALAGVGLVLALFLFRHGRQLRAQLWAAPMAVLALLGALGTARPDAPACPGRGTLHADAQVTRVRFGAEETRVRLAVIRGRWQPGNQRVPPGLAVDVSVPLAEAPANGSVVRFEGLVRPRAALRNPSLQPPNDVATGGCWGRLVDRSTLRPIRVTGTQQATLDVRQHVRARLVEGLPAEVSAVARALVLGDGSALPNDLRRRIADVGLAHLFAVSGLHIALVSGTLVRLLRWFLCGLLVRADPSRVAAALGVPITLLHAVLAGGAPSAWRAAMTAAITWTIVVFNRRPSAAAVTGAAALLLSAPDPTMATRPAFLLSIVSTSAILASPTVRSGRLRWLRSASTISARTLVATTPMVWWWFGSVPLIGWVTNIIVLPFGSLVVIPLAHLFAIFGSTPSVGTALGLLLTGATQFLLQVCAAFAPLALSNRLPPLDAAQGLIVLCACTLLLVVRRWRARVAVLSVAAFLWLAAERRIVAREQPSGLVRATFVDVGQGDAALLDFPDGSLTLIDTGQGGSHPAGRAVTRLLRERRRGRIDRVIITHGHPDHFGALPQLLSEVRITELWLNGQLLAEEDDATMRSLVEEARRRGTRVRFAPELCGTHDIGGAFLDVLWPCPRYDPTLDLNDNSIVVRLRFGRHRFVFTGDLEAEGETRLVHATDVGRADVLKVPHHGSKTSSTALLVDALEPGVAVVSLGAANSYGHPSDAVIDRLRSSGALVLRTDDQGAIIVETDGERMQVRTAVGPVRLR